VLALAKQVEVEYPVFRLVRDTGHLSYWQSVLFWKVYRPFAHWCHRRGLPTIVDKDGARLVLQSVATTESRARAMCGALGDDESPAFYKDAPVDVSLPKGEVVFGGNKYPYYYIGKAADQNEIPVVCPFTHEMCQQHETISRSRITKLHQQIKDVVAL